MITARLALLLLLAGALLLPAAPAHAVTALATVHSPEGLHLRAGPGTEHRSLGVIPDGTVIALTGALSGRWYPAVHGSQSGWVHADYVTLAEDAERTSRPATVQATGGLNLRAEPHRGATILTLMPDGAALTVSGRTTTSGWVLATYQGQTGWANATYLRFPATTATPAPAATPTPTAPATAAPAGSGGAPVPATITYYHPSLEGGVMRCGGTYRAEDPTIAAATSWPCGTRLRVCRNGACVVVTVQDTGHMGPNWVDLSASAFRQLAPLPDAMVRGTVEVLD